MTFKIDDQTVGSYIEVPSGDTTYRFGVTVFHASGLSNAAHTLTLESGHSERKALVLLDSIIYTYVTFSSALVRPLRARFLNIKQAR